MENDLRRGHIDSLLGFSRRMDSLVDSSEGAVRCVRSKDVKCLSERRVWRLEAFGCRGC
jgi:hypothetical protein